MVKCPVCHSVRQILLLHIVIRVIMGVFIALTPPQFFGSAVMPVLQMDRHRCRDIVLHRVHRLHDGIYRGVALRGAGHIGRRLTQNDLALRHADPFHLLGSARRHHHGHRICVSHVLGGTDHDAPRDEAYILTRVQHSGEIIDRGVRVRSPHALYKCGDRIVVIVPVPFVPEHPLLDALLRHRQGDADPAVLVRRRGEDPQLHRVDGGAGIAVRHIREIRCRLFCDLRVVAAHALHRVRDRAVHEGADILRLQRLQLKDPGPGKERRVHFKIRVFRSGADEDDGPVLHEWQKVVLLPLVEPVDLIDEEDRPFPVGKRLLRFGHHFLHVLLSCGCGVDLAENRTRGVGDHHGKSGLPRAGRAVENKRSQLVRLDGAVKELVLPQDVALSHDLVQFFRAKTRSERRLTLQRVLTHKIKQIHI